MKSNFKNARILIAELVHSNDRKSLMRILIEALQLSIINRTGPAYYFSRHLYQKEQTNIWDYVPNRIMYSLSDHFNEKNPSQILNNKLFYGLFFEQFKINVPKILMYNHKKTFVIGDKPVEINTLEELRKILEDLSLNKSTSNSVFIKKTYDSHGGSNTYRLDGNKKPWDQKYLANLYEEVIRTSYLFQDTIQQHPDMDILNPSCINTIRLDTFTDPNGRPEVMSGYLRMSISNLHVDNLSSGGCCVGVDLLTGKLKKYGYTSYSKARGKILTAHPVTKIPFEGFQIPLFEQTRELLLKVASLVPSLRLVGWDIAISKNGPVLVEGNCGYDITYNDLTYGGYRNNPGFKKVLQEYQTIRKQKVL